MELVQLPLPHRSICLSHRLFSVYSAELIALFLRLRRRSALNKDTICLLLAQPENCHLCNTAKFVRFIWEGSMF